jgi:flagellar basal-body rod modification protein FlgD
MISPLALLGHSPSALQPNRAATTTQTASAAPATSSSTATATATTNDSLSDPNTFITLLTAQLQAQDPLNPMDPSEMVDQLTQINSLQQLIQIQSDLQNMMGTPSTTPQANAAAVQASAPVSNAAQIASPNSVGQTNTSPSGTLANNQ